jgi:osmotically-inducible protein OsmY
MFMSKAKMFFSLTAIGVLCAAAPSKMAGCDQQTRQAPLGPRAPVGPGGRYDYDFPAEEQSPPPGHFTLNDQNIEAAITSALLFDEGVPSQRITVEVKDGIAKLSGVVETLRIKQRAAELALAIKGVRSVVNDLDVYPTDIAAKELATDVRNTLLLDPATEAYEVTVEADDQGAVTLDGTVDSWQEKKLATRLAASVQGVREVENNISVIPASARPDSEILDEIRERLDMDVRVDDSLIDVQVDDGRVRLSGAVDSAAAKSRAITDCWVAGVQAVDGSELKVKWYPLAQLRAIRHQPVVKSDTKIEKTIRKAFRYDPRVKSYKPLVLSQDGVVTLTGTVGDLLAKKAAAQIARFTAGVKRIRNHIRVEPKKVLEDAEIKQRVIEKLKSSPFVQRHDITVTVNNGVVYLDGTVNSRFEKGRAGFLASTVYGVVEVKNYLVLSDQWTRTPDWVLEERVKSNLYWSPYVNIDRIAVEVDDGAVSLVGRVENWFARRKAIANAWKAGPRTVHDKLRVGLKSKWCLPLPAAPAATRSATR